jgi:hypothetical protein
MTSSRLGAYWEATMRVPDFYSINEAKKPANQRVYHNADACPSGRDIPAHERRAGTGGYRHCDNCRRLG